jgi:pyruvate formate lyase activating enzyme
MDIQVEQYKGQFWDRMIEGCVLDIDRFSSHDGPGIRTTVFLKGCPLACRWCHSPESQSNAPQLLYRAGRCTGCDLCLDACPESAISADARVAVTVDRSICTDCGQCALVCYPGALSLAGRRVSAGDLVEDVARDLPFYESSGGGVTVSGGEPARQHEFTRHFLLACRERGIHTAVETSGYGRRDHVSAIAAAADLVMYDVKFVDEELHRRHTGVSNSIIIENLRYLASEHSNVLVRVPCIAGVNDGVTQVAETAGLIADLGLSRIELLPYNGAAGAKYEWLDRPYPLEGTSTQDDRYMSELADICRESGLDVKIGE